MDRRILHIFDPDFHRSAISREDEIAVVGGGLSGCQIAIALSRDAAGGLPCRGIRLIRRRPAAIRAYDSDPGYIGVKKGAAFSRIRDYHRRRRIIREARWPGSIPGDVAAEIAEAARRGDFAIVEGEIISADVPSWGPVSLRLADGRRIAAGAVVLATGFEDDLPERPWIRDLAAAEGLPVHTDGYPVPDGALRWAPGLYVTGGLAELEMGPSGLNIIGAHRAADRILEGLAAGK
jgi:cation diffusion facilitator CzcD-associated flavoprotein CzcO